MPHFKKKKQSKTVPQKKILVEPHTWERHSAPDPIFSAGSSPTPELVRDLLFLSPTDPAPLLYQHYHTQSLHRSTYLGVFAALIRLKTPLTAAVRAKALAAALARKDTELVTDLLAQRDLFDVPEVVRALNLLDANRQLDAAIAKYGRWVSSGNRVGSGKVGQLKSDINDLLAYGPTVGRLNSSTAKLLRRVWISSLTKNDLEFGLLRTTGDNWRAICDLIHPRADDFSIPWFLPVLYGSQPPPNSLVASIKSSGDQLDAKMLRSLLKYHGMSYVQIRPFAGSNLTDDLKALVANRESLENILWYYSDLACPEVDKILARRLDSPSRSAINIGFPKLLELLMRSRDKISRGSPSLFSGWSRPPWYKSIMALANEKLKAMELSLDAPVLVHGDASSSMTSAVRAASITGGIVTALCDADLVFFNSRLIKAPLKPTDVDGILTVADRVKASGTTANAAGLYEAYMAKKVYQTIVTLTDEQENTSVGGFRFVDLYAKYREEVSPDCKLVMVSFLPSSSSVGHLTRQLDQRGLEYVQFKMNVSQPDFNKLDDMLASLGTSSASFTGLVSQLAQAASTHRLATLSKLSLDLLASPVTAVLKENTGSSLSTGRSSQGSGTGTLQYGPAVEAMVDAALSGASHGDVVVAASRVRLVAQRTGMADAVLLAKELVSTLVGSGKEAGGDGLTSEATSLVVVEGEKWLNMAMDAEVATTIAPSEPAPSLDGRQVLLPSSGVSVNSRARSVRSMSTFTSRLGSVLSAAGARLSGKDGKKGDGTQSEASGWSMV